MCVLVCPALSLKPQGWWTKYCGIGGVIALSSGAVSLLLIVSGVLSTQIPAGYTKTVTGQSGVVSVAERVNSFWYSMVEVRMTGDDTIKLSAASCTCSELVSKNIFIYSHSAPNLTRDQGNEPLQLLWDHGYLVEKSTLNLTITIVVPPTNGAAPVLYQLNNWTQYWSLLPSDDPPYTDQYVTRYPISRTGNTTVSITVTSTDFHFFFLYLPTTTTFQYQFSLNRYYYSPDDYNFTCSTSSINRPCLVTLNPSKSLDYSTQQCLLVLPKSSDSDSFKFLTINTTIKRFLINLLSLILLTLMGLVVLVFLVALVYLLLGKQVQACIRSGFIWCCATHQEKYKELS